MRRVVRTDRSRTIAGGIGQERVAAAHEVLVNQQARATITVAGNALDVGDCRELLRMLGLDSLPPRAPRLRA
ncbi:hypothetical protein [Kutzneria kofuensis]|uniref:Uncharacterized protein n=1 Tax=Kutzneria kofuensis TaxID=103725 RepID=A0A7W9KFQ5_9PSEU|nr:hypothetical protein [Kutzneria kofuensis]MBB5890989.1 hypothetical protein [Kutzneria kofuensis]